MGKLNVRFAMVVAMAAIASTSAQARAQSAECKTAMAPQSKLYDKPFHMYSVDTAQTDAGLHGGQPRVNETIWTGDAAYIMSRGKWTKSKVNAADLRTREVDPDKKYTCSRLRDESVNGETATLWRIHEVSDDDTIDTDEWISKGRGLVLKTDVHMDVGGALGKSHIVMRYEYDNVRLPAGVR
ncbi:MAG TPA: hypothetical protein VGM82_23545 [Gemmatimonadaceae bacterium]